MAERQLRPDARRDHRESRSGEQRMRIEGTVRANLIAAVAGARRWRGRRVHRDTVEHWQRLLDYGRLAHRQPCGESVDDLVAELEFELAHAKVI